MIKFIYIITFVKKTVLVFNYILTCNKYAKRINIVITVISCITIQFYAMLRYAILMRFQCNAMKN